MAFSIRLIAGLLLPVCLIGDEPVTLTFARDAKWIARDLRALRDYAQS
jgi:hypothetical protein